VRNDIDSSEISFSQFQENIFLNIRCNGRTRFLLGNIYRSPNSDVHNDAELFSLINTVAGLNNTQILLVGDFNFPDIDWNIWSSSHGSSQSTAFIDVLRDNMLLQHVTMPTRARGSDNPHTLDLVITNDHTIENIEIMAPLGNSDHSLLDISYNISGYPHTYTKKLNFKKGDYNNLRKDLHIDWDTVLCDNSNDIEKLWTNFKDIIHQAIMNNIPTVCNFASWKKSKWKRPLDKNTLALIKEKRRLWKLYIYTKQAHIFRDYRKITNKLRKCTRDINRAEQCEIAFTVKDNPKKFWNFVNSKRKNKERIGDLEYVTAMGVKDTANTDEVKADILNTFFPAYFLMKVIAIFLVFQLSKYRKVCHQ